MVWEVPYCGEHDAYRKSIIHKRIWHGQVARMTGKLFILKFAMSPVHRQPKAFESHAPL